MSDLTLAGKAEVSVLVSRVPYDCLVNGFTVGEMSVAEQLADRLKVNNIITATRNMIHTSSVTHTPTSILAPGGPVNDPAMGGTDSGKRATATEI